MNININNLHINVFINQAPVLDEEPIFETEFDLEDDFDEEFDELSRAEKALYETASEEAEATAGDDYWDELFDKAAKEFAEEPEFVTISNDYYVQSLRGKKVRVVETEPEMTLIELEGWTGGHAGQLDDGSFSRWWVPNGAIIRPLKVGDRVRHTGKGKPDAFTNAHEGFHGVSLIGKVGTVVRFGEEEGNLLVAWEDWNDGHDGNTFDGSQDKWWVWSDNLEKVN